MPCARLMAEHANHANAVRTAGTPRLMASEDTLDCFGIAPEILWRITALPDITATGEVFPHVDPQ